MDANDEIDFSLFLKCRYFDCIDICKIRDNWEETRLIGTLMPLKSISCVLLTVLEPTEAEFTLFQEGQRSVESYNI